MAETVQAGTKHGHTADLVLVILTAPATLLAEKVAAVTLVAQ
jgi:hypothetical protein